METLRTRPGRVGAGVILISIAALLLLSACAGAPGPNNVANVATGHISGFWAGVWHGIIIPITFIVSLFTNDVSIYDVHNNGNWYDFGFVLGAAILTGAGNAASRR